MSGLREAINKLAETHGQEVEISEIVMGCYGEQVAVNVAIADLLQRMCEEKHEHRVRMLAMFRAACDTIEETLS